MDAKPRCSEFTMKTKFIEIFILSATVIPHRYDYTIVWSLSMDWDTVARFVLGFAAIVTAWKTFFDVSSGNKINLREEYNFAKGFLNDSGKETLHPYVLSKGYQAIAGTITVKSNEIEYILSLKDPVQCLHDFIFSKQMFERLEVERDFKLVFKKKYKTKFSRVWRKSFYSICYVIMSFLALSPMVLSSILGFSSSEVLIKIMFTLPFFGLYAWLSMKACVKIVRAEYLFNNQSQSASRVLL